MPQPTALQRTDRFVARTMNWMYDHLRHVPRYAPVVMTDVLENRAEFPELAAFDVPWRRLGSRIWKKFAQGRPYPPDLRRARGFRPVVLHSHFGYIGVADLALQRALDLPWVVAFYGADVYLRSAEANWMKRYPELFERATTVLALGPVMKDALCQLGCPREKVEVHPLGVDVDSVPHRVRTFDRGGPLEILFAGTFREKKGITYLLDAAGLLRRRGVDFRLHLVGDAAGREGDQGARRDVEESIARNGIEEKVVRYSWLGFTDLMALALDCHVFVAPSVTARDGDSEGTPFVIQQMMLSEMPVVSTRHSDIPYLFGPLADQLVAERDATAIADRLQQFVDEPDRVTAEGRQCRQRMVDAFDIRRCASHLADVYDRVADRS